MKLKPLRIQAFDKEKHIGAGMALVLIFLLTGYFTGDTAWYKVSIPALLVCMAFPKLYYPFTILWYGLSDRAGRVMPRLVLGLVYLFLVIPVGLIRRIAGKDRLNLKGFGRDRPSAFTDRDILYTKDDLINPY